jgi:hypothetical protein
VDGGLRKKLLFDEFDKEGKFKVFSFSSLPCFILIVSRSFILWNLWEDDAEETIVLP